MPDRVARLFVGLLVLVHVGLAAWAAVGFAELLLDEVPWTRISNPLFSRSMLLLQWSLVGTAAVVFITGTLRRWRHTPVAMLGIYGAMAATCAYQTFFILVHDGRFVAMAVEYVEYTVILGFLFFSDHARHRFA